MKLKMIALFLAMLMLVSVFAGCADTTTDEQSSEPAESSKESSEEASEEEGGEAELLPNNIPAEVLANPIFKETPENLECFQKTDPVTLSVFYNAVVADAWTWGEDPVTAEIQKLTGVTIDGRYAADSEGNELTLMIASGDELPDMLSSINTTSAQYSELVEGGLVYPINELMDQYAPKMYDVLFPLETSYYNDDNGNFYFIGRQAILPGLTEYGTANGWYAVRQDVYEELGSPSLSSIDDIWNLLEDWEASKDNWPEIKYPWLDPVLQGTGNISVAYAMLGGKAQYSSGSNYVYDSETQTVKAVVTTELGKEALKFYYEMAQKGYITQESFAFTGDSGAELSAGTALMYAKMNVWEVGTTAAALAENIPGASYSLIKPIYAEGVDYHYYDAAFRAATNATVITKNCSDPERAILFLEFMATEYGNLLATAGVYGEHWQYKTLDNGNIGIEYINDAVDATWRTENGLYNYNKYWFNLTTNYDLMTAFSAVEPGSIKADIASYIERNVCFSAPNFVSFASDSQEQVTMTGLNEILSTYVTKIILSENEDAFEANYAEMITALESSGLNEITAAYAEKCTEWVETLEAAGVEFID